MTGELLGLRAICDLIGDISSPYSMSETIKRHRFGDWEHPGFGEVSRRWNSPAQEVRTIVLNTYLDHFVRKPRKLLEEYGASLGSSELGALFYETVRVHLIEILSDENASSPILAGLGMSIPFVAQFAQGIELSVEEKVDLVMNNWASNTDYNGGYEMGCRALGIRKIIDEGEFHLALLCEVWDEVEFVRLSGRDRNLEIYDIPPSYPAGPWPYNPVAVPGFQYHPKSGLLAMLMGESFPVLHWEFHPYKAKGRGDLDVEFYSEKGVQLSRIQTTYGIIDFYQTHLHYGGALTTAIEEGAGDYKDQFKQAIQEAGATLNDPTPNERTEVRKKQLGELAQFIKDTRLPESIVVVAGDFNIEGWTDEAGSPITSPYTGDDKDNYGGRESLKAVMQDELGLEDMAIRMGLSNQGTQNAPLRIDYVFVEKPTANQGLVVDIFDMTVSMLQNEKGEDLSDHKALTLTLRCAPKKI